MYGTRYIVPFYSLDGYFYRVLLKRRGYSGASEELRGYQTSVRIEAGRPGEPDLTEPLFGSRCTVTILDPFGGLFVPISRSDNAAWQIVLQRDTVSTYESAQDIGTWYVPMAASRRSPYSHIDTPSVTGDDGFGLLASVPLDPQVSGVDLIGIIWTAVNTLGLQGGLRTLMRWYPYASTHHAATSDPLSILGTSVGAWTNEEGRQTPFLEALREVLARFWLRCFQSEGHWYAWQRHALIGATPTVWKYGAFATLEGRETLSIAVEDKSITISGTPYSDSLPLVREVTSVFEPLEGLENLIANGDFEATTDGGLNLLGSVPFWNTRSTGSAEHAETLPMTTILSDASAGEGKALRIYGDQLGGVTPRIASSQELGVTILENVEHELRLSFDSQFNNGGNLLNVPGRVLVEVGTYSLTQIPVFVVQDATASDNAALHIYPLGFVPPPGTSIPDRVAGTVVIPKGAVLQFNNFTGGTAELTLSRDAAIGDDVLHGSLSADLKGSADGRGVFYYWEETTLSSTGITMSPGSTFFSTSAWVKMVTPQGDPVSGQVKVTLLMPVVQGAPTNVPVSTVYSDLDEIRLEYLVDGRPVHQIRWQAAVGSPIYGESVVAGPFMLGDGPTASSESRLIQVVGGQDELTMHGLNTGWKDGAYSPGEPTTGETLDMLYARKLLLAQSEGLERLLCDFVLRNQQKFFPHNVLRHYQFARLAYAAVTGTTHFITHVPIRPGTTVTLDGETTVVTDVQGIGPYKHEIAGVWAQDHAARTPVFFTKDYVPDYLDWDVASGLLRFEGTELMESDQDYTISQVIQQS